MAEVFVSYDSDDRERVRPIVRILEKQGLGVWWDRDLLAGVEWPAEIEKQINAASCVVVVWTEASVESNWVYDEATRGRDRGLLIPVSLDGSAAPMGFGRLHMAELSGWNGNEQDTRIIDLVENIVDRVRVEVRLPPPDPLPAVDDEPAGIGPAADRPGDPRPDTPRADENPPDDIPPGGGSSASRVFSRRRLLVGGSAVALATVGGTWLITRPRVPAARTETLETAAVDQYGRPTPGQTLTVPVFDLAAAGVTFPFSVVGEGPVTIGSPDNEPGRQLNEGPQRTIPKVSSFAIGRTTVTQEQWNAVAVSDRDGAPLRLGPSFFKAPDLPVESISWREATAFCARLSRLTGLTIRLPGEVEWEYACRAGSTTPFHVGSTITPNLANYCGTGGAVRGYNRDTDISSDQYGTESYPLGSYGNGPVGIFRSATVAARSFPPNAFGLYQMHGNVWEHCADTGVVDYRQIPLDGSPYDGDDTKRVLRGGSWSHNPAICRSAYRDTISADSTGWDGRIGLRIVCEL